MPDTSILPILCESRLNRQIIGKSRLTASLIAALSERRKSLLNHTTLTGTVILLAIHLLIPVWELLLPLLPLLAGVRSPVPPCAASLRPFIPLEAIILDNSDRSD